MRYAIRHVTRFDYAEPVGFARCNLRLKPIHWSGQELHDYSLTILPGGDTAPARAEAGLANVVRLVVTEAVRSLTIESRCTMTVDRPVPMPASDDPTLAQVAAEARASRDAGPASPASYLFPSPLIPLDRDIAEWCAQELDPSRRALEAAIALACRIQNEFAFDPTATLVDTPPREAFLKRGGV
jgi:transglutaminase-like putative cysteine protease